MKEFFGYITSKLFFTHLAIATVSLFLLLWMLFKLLGSYTHHGEVADVPDFKGKKIYDLNKFIKGKNVRYAIIDSIYDPKQETGIVIKQEPEANSEVKHNRIIYLYVTSTQAPNIEMPKLVDKSTRQAILMIVSYGLKQGRITEIASDCKGCVIKQMYNGKEIKTGTPIKKGSKIDLVVGVKDLNYVMPSDTIETINNDDVD